MQIKNSQIVTFINGTVNLQEKKLPIKVGYAITKNLNLIRPLAEAYEEQRKKILDAYAEKGDEGQFIVKDSAYVIEDESGYGKELEELLGIENEIDLHLITLEELEKCDTEQFESLSMQDLALLDIMMQDM